MKQQRIVIGTGCIVVVLFDLVASLAARHFEFAYVRASIGSYFIYLIVGFLAGRVARDHRARAGTTAAAIVALADVSIGWAVSWAIGPGRPPSGTLAPVAWLLTAAVVVVFGSTIGYVGGVLGARSRPTLDLAS